MIIKYLFQEEASITKSGFQEGSLLKLKYLN